jgi:hypothetical protein
MESSLLLRTSLSIPFIHSFITWMKIDHLSISFINRMDDNGSLLDGHLSISFCNELLFHVIHHMDGKVALGWTLVYIICHMDENVSLWMNTLLVSLVTWMKTLGLKYHSSYGWRCCPWIELLFIKWMKTLHLDIHISNIIHHIWMQQLFHLDEHFVFIIHHKDENVAFGWTFYCHSLYGWKCCTWMNTYLDHSSIWMKMLHLDEHLFRSFIIWIKMFQLDGRV